MNSNSQALGIVEDGWREASHGGPLANTGCNPWVKMLVAVKMVIKQGGSERCQGCGMVRTWSLLRCVHKGRGGETTLQSATTRYAKSFKTCPLYTLWPPVYQHSRTPLASPAFFQPLNLPSSFSAHGLCSTLSFWPGRLSPWVFAKLSLLIQASDHVISLERASAILLSQPWFHMFVTLLSKISFLLNYSCVNFLRGLFIHTAVYVSVYVDGQGSSWAPQQQWPHLPRPALPPGPW